MLPGVDVCATNRRPAASHGPLATDDRPPATGPWPLTALLAAALAASGCGAPPPAPASAGRDAVDVAVVSAVRGDIEATLEISGSLAPARRVGVTAKVPGRLERVLVDLGDRVAAGATLATLERQDAAAAADQAAAAVAVARAGVEAAEAALANATQEAARARALFEKGALPRQRLDAAETAHRASAAQHELARATVSQAEAAERRARELLRDTALTSPITGVIVERNFDAGALVGRGEPPVAVVADIRTLTLEAGVSELEAGRLVPGMPASVDVAARPGRPVAARVAAIAPLVDQRNRHFRVELRIDNPRGELLPGMYAVARIRTAAAAGAVLVPREAVGARGDRRIVLVVDGDRVRVTEVTVGISGDRLVQIVSGVSEGQLVVADARRDVAPDVRVNPIGR